MQIAYLDVERLVLSARLLSRLFMTEDIAVRCLSLLGLYFINKCLTTVGRNIRSQATRLPLPNPLVPTMDSIKSNGLLFWIFMFQCNMHVLQMWRLVLNACFLLPNIYNTFWVGSRYKGSEVVLIGMHLYLGVTHLAMTYSNIPDYIVNFGWGRYFWIVPLQVTRVASCRLH